MFLAGLYRAEQAIAGRLISIASGKLPWPPIDVSKAVGWIEERTGLRLGESQRDAIRLALASKALVITGGPGVGKTTIVASIASTWSRGSIPLITASMKFAPPSSGDAPCGPTSTSCLTSPLSARYDFIGFLI
jgi:exodeoxyribonuclease V alpha subunit